MEKKNKKVTTINELAVIMRDSFQSNQEYMDKRFDQIEKKFDDKFAQVDKKFDQVTEKINNISLNIVDVVRKEEFDKLENRVMILEEKPAVSAKK